METFGENIQTENDIEEPRVKNDQELEQHEDLNVDLDKEQSEKMQDKIRNMF